MLDVSGYGCLAARGQGERHSASTYKFVNVDFPACSILLHLVSQDSTGSPDCTLVCGWVGVRVSSPTRLCIFFHLTVLFSGQVDGIGGPNHLENPRPQTSNTDWTNRERPWAGPSPLGGDPDFRPLEQGGWQKEESNWLAEVSKLQKLVPQVLPGSIRPSKIQPISPGLFSFFFLSAWWVAGSNETLWAMCLQCEERRHWH